MTKFEFFFDVSSPWTYLAFSQIEALAQRCDVEIIWKPILVGGVFNAVNETVYETRANPHPVKGRHYLKDLKDWTRFCGVKIGNPPVFPVRSINIMRACLVALDEGCLPTFAKAAFEAYWGELKDISQPQEIAAIAEAAGLDPLHLGEAIQSQSVKDRLRQNTEELIARGGFGSPSMFINDDDMYFGNDRLPLVEAALMAARAQEK